MSHEIRTPLNGVIGMTGLLLDTPLNDGQREFATIIRDSGTALLAVINDVLDFSKMEAGKFELDAAPFAPLRLVEGIADLLAATAHEKGLSLMTFVAPEVPARLLGDAARLRQALLNLAGNAVKFTDRGDVVVRLTVVAEADQDITLRFAVTDSGIGLSTASLKRLFEPFVQADGSASRRYGGTGLGLSITKRLVTLMGGDVGVESEEGVGSTFWFTARFTRALALVPPEPCPITDLRGTRVLVVDDNATCREIIHRYVLGWGMRYGSATTAEEALMVVRGAAAGDPYDVAIVDLVLPGLDGLGLARAIRSDPDLAGTKLVLLTAFDRGLRGQEALRSGFAASLSKPVRQSQLFDAITHAIAGRPADNSPPAPALNGSTSTPAPNQLAPIGDANGEPGADTILLAEDHPVNQKLARLQLRKLGYAVHVAANGREAVDAVLGAPGRFTAVLMDCQMPLLDGFEATRLIRVSEVGTSRHLPIIAMTANALQGDRDACLAAGMDDYVSKPVDPGSLGQTLERWAERVGAVVMISEAPTMIDHLTAHAISLAGTALPTAAMGPGWAGRDAGVAIDCAFLDSLRELQEPDESDVVQELSSLFVSETSARLDHLAILVSQRDSAAIGRLVHGLKGSAATFNAGPMARCCAAIEVAEIAGDIDRVSVLIGDLRDEFERVQAALLDCAGGR